MTINECYEQVNVLKEQRNPLLWEQMEMVIKEHGNKDDIVAKYFSMAKASEYARGLLIANDGPGAEKLLLDYVEAMLQYLEVVYTPEAFEGNMEVLMPEQRAAIYLSPVFDESTVIDVRQAIACLKRAVGEDNLLGENIKIYARYLGDCNCNQ